MVGDNVGDVITGPGLERIFSRHFPRDEAGEQVAKSGSRKGNAKRTALARTTITLPLALDRNLELYCVKKGGHQEQDD